MKTPNTRGKAAPHDSFKAFPVPAAASIPAALEHFDALPDAAHVRLPVVASLFACSPATVWRRVKSGTLPAPRKLSEGVTAWRVAELRKALNGEAWQ